MPQFHQKPDSIFLGVQERPPRPWPDPRSGLQDLNSLLGQSASYCIDVIHFKEYMVNATALFI
jgi:hypothetical protein